MTKLTIIGAGSAVFTKNIFTDLMFIGDFKKMDIAREIKTRLIEFWKQITVTRNIPSLNSITHTDTTYFHATVIQFMIQFEK